MISLNFVFLTIVKFACKFQNQCLPRLANLMQFNSYLYLLQQNRKKKTFKILKLLQMMKIYK